MPLSRIDIAWEDLLATAREKQKPKLPLGEHDFRQIAWGQLDPLALAQALLDPRKSYAGHMEVLFAVFTGWVSAPSKPTFQRAATRHAIRRVATRIERRGGTQSIITSFLNRTFTGLHFTENIYLPTGGISGLARTPSRSSLNKQRVSIEREVEPLIRLARQFHHIVPELATTRYHRPSMNKLAGNVGMHENSIDKRWLKYRQTIALRYAATSLVDDDRSLWQSVVDDSAWANYSPARMAEWLGRARWYAAEILMRCADARVARENLRYLPDVELKPFAVPKPTDREVRDVRNALLIH